MSEEVMEAPVEIPDDLAAPGYGPGETAADTAAADNETQITDGQQPRHRGGFQRRIDRLTRDKSAAEQERDYWREQALRGFVPQEYAVEEQPHIDPAYIEAIQAHGYPEQHGYLGQSAYSAHVQHPEGKPIPDLFETQAEYLEALADWKLEQREKQRDAEHQIREEQAQERQQFADREHAFRQSSPDYDDVIAEAIAREVPMSHPLWTEVREHAHGPALLYYLAAHPEEAERLAQMSPVEVAREVGRLESRFVSSADTPQMQVAAAAVSRAPKPPNPVGRGATHTSGKDPGEMEPHEYREWRRKQFPNL